MAGDPNDLSAQEVFTTTEAARLCGMSKQKIVNLFDEGQIEGYRVPGEGGRGGRARRIPRKNLLEFMRKHGIPTERLEKPRTYRILVVEDDPVSQELMTAIFSREPDRFEVKIAARGSDAAVLAGSFHPDVILLDIMLPDLAGSEVFRSLRKIEGLDSTKVVVISALDDDKVRREMLEEGVDAYFVKPVHIRQLTKKIYRLLGLPVAE
jgi:excisionase family DNA binding protein